MSHGGFHMRGSQEILRQLEKRKIFGVKENSALGVNWFLDLFLFLCYSEQFHPLPGLFPHCFNKGVGPDDSYHPLQKKISQNQTDQENRAVHFSNPQFPHLQNGYENSIGLC